MPLNNSGASAAPLSSPAQASPSMRGFTPPVTSRSPKRECSWRRTGCKRSAKRLHEEASSQHWRMEPEQHDLHRSRLRSHDSALMSTSLNPWRTGQPLARASLASCCGFDLSWPLGSMVRRCNAYRCGSRARVHLGYLQDNCRRCVAGGCEGGNPRRRINHG